MRAWTRQGVVVTVPRGAAWASHAQMPAVLPLADDLWRIYFAARDEDNRATVYAVDVDPARDMRVLARYERPLLSPGSAGTFDAAGLGPSCALRSGGRILLYYTGVTVRADVPHQQAIGLAVSDDGLAFERATPGPVLATGPRDPYFASMAFVRATASGYEMWYTSGTAWETAVENRQPCYTVRRAASADGVVWSAATSAALHPSDDDTRATRAWITGGKNGSELWFSRRGGVTGSGAYRLVHAPLNAAGTAAVAPGEPVRFANPPQAGDWDADMQAYGCVVPFRDTLVMFYNGNEFGRFGFGWATAAGG